MFSPKIWEELHPNRFGNKPKPSSVDREVALAKRMCSYAVEAKLVDTNPLAGTPLLNVPNTRDSVVNEEDFAKLHEAADLFLKPILLVAYDTGMRKGEILNLLWDQIDFQQGTIRLRAQDTKTSCPRLIVLTSRVLDTLRVEPHHLRSPFVFVNPSTGKPWHTIQRTFYRARDMAKLGGLWFHDLRRSFITNARRRGVPESVVMRMSGHKTRSVFDRYNIVSDDDLRDAVKLIEGGQGLDKVEGDQAVSQQRKKT